MPLELRPASESDALRAVEIEGAAYGTNGLTPILFPGPFPADARARQAETLVRQRRENPTTRWAKIVDTDLPAGDGQMVAFAKWHVYPENPVLAPRVFGEGCNLEACQKLFGGLQAQRARLMTGPHVYLHLLQTDPDHKRRGAGTLLVKEVLEEARKLGLVVYLQATPQGRPLYTKLGFKDIELHEVHFREWGSTETSETWAMGWKPDEN